jgi:hypothetical protein
VHKHDLPANQPIPERDEFVHPTGQQPPRVLARARFEEGGCDERPDVAGAPDPGRPLDRCEAGGVHDEVEIDPGVSPELEAGEIGGRRAGRHRLAAASSQGAEHARCRRIGRDDDVGPVAVDQPQQRSCPEQR